MTTITDVAKACGLSTATVSLVINNSSLKVSPKTRDRVMRVIQEMQYRPSVHARRLSMQRADTIGVVTKRREHLLADFYYGMLIDSIVECAADLDQTVAIYNGRIWRDEDKEGSKTQILFADGRCDGVLLLLAEDDSKLIQGLQQACVPFVTVNSAIRTDGVNSVDINNVDAGYKMTRYLLDQGHQRIACLRTEDYFSSERMAGYRAALEEAGEPFEERLIFTGDYQPESSGFIVGQQIARDTSLGVTAIFAATDALACDAIQGIKDAGLRVPNDISVVGINDTWDAARCNPPLTTLRQSVEEIGATALHLLLDIINAPESNARQLVLPTQIIVRDSVAPPRMGSIKLR